MEFAQLAADDEKDERTLPVKPLPAFEDPETKKLIQALCTEQQIDDQLLKDLCEIMQMHSGAGRKPDVDADIAAMLDRYLMREKKT